LNTLPPDTALEEASANNKRKTTDGDDDSKSTRRKLNDETHGPNEEIPEFDDDPDEDEHETSSAAHVYKAFSDSTLGKDPKTLKEAMNSPEWPEWEKAVKTELTMLNEMGTWELADTPDDRQPITNKWVFVRNIIKMVIYKSTRHDW
jgi:hypothetical protein